MKTRFWRTHWFVGGLVTALVAGASGAGWLEGLERKVYDWGATAADARPSDRIVVIAIDDPSIASLGSWPWPRDRHGELIRQLAEGGAHTIAYTVPFHEPQAGPGLPRIRDLLAHLEQGELTALADRIGNAELAERVRAGFQGIHQRLQRAQFELATDQRLAEALDAAANVVLGTPLRLAAPNGRPDPPLPEYLRASAIDIAALEGTGHAGLPAHRAQPPIEPIGRAAAAIGHLGFDPGIDGVVRTQPLVADHFGERYPALALVVAARGLGLDAGDAVFHPGGGMALGDREIATDGAQRMNVFFYRDGAGGQPPFPVDSFHDVVSGRVATDAYRDKIVLVGLTASGLGAARSTPVSAATAPVMTLAHSVSSILEQHYFTRPDWARWASLGAFAVVGLYLIVLVPRAHGAVSAAIGAVLLGGLAAGEYELLSTHRLWVPLAAPGALLVFGYMLMFARRHLAAERGKLRADARSAESNRMLGLSLQSQGQLDAAFEKYRGCPLDEPMMEVLYNLGLDYERKRQFNKASNVYDYMARYDDQFRDIATRRKRTQAMEETIVLGARAGGSPEATRALDNGDVERPELGRHELEREIGKGAMGVVYQGRDPKINRVVAIKTLALSQEYEGEELAEARERFFREAETAGRLNHPNIVTIYDAGEEHDLAYIAMEYLQGEDLTRYTKKELLPVDEALEIAATCADALAYAHEQGVVHRDIKPGNIVYDRDAGTLKLTDFGIARITDASRTSTGMVLGTPSYMSPEQVAGDRVDGRSDLYSLGVMLYQLLSGTLPFIADNMAALMYKIANDDPVPIGRNADVAPGVARIVSRAMKKDPDERYADGRQMAAALRRCAARTRGHK